jgi:phosphoglycerate dehydrogenase-like enzyme
LLKDCGTQADTDDKARCRIFMDLLVVEPLDPEVLQWLEARHALHCAPELAHDAREFRRAVATVRAVIVPPAVALDAETLAAAPSLRVVGRLSSGPENIDLEACAQLGIEVVRPVTASAGAEAEFVVGALLQLLRRVPVLAPDGLLAGRELDGATVGIVGMTPAARPLAALLGAFGSRVVGYDPALHASDPLWQRWQVAPMGLRALMRESDGVAVLLTYFSRYRGLFGERFLAEGKPNQVMVSLSHSSLFDEAALADALVSGRMAAAWFDSMEPGMLDAGRPLHDAPALQVTPRVASTTIEARRRGAWAVARRIDEILAPPPGAALTPEPTDDRAGHAGVPGPA